MTCRENVAVAVMFGNREQRESAKALGEAGRMLALVGLEHKADVLSSNLTVQERKRLEFARVLGTGARIVLLDEIFAGLVAEELRDAMNLFERVQKEIGFGALIVEHVMRPSSPCPSTSLWSRRHEDREGSPRTVVEDPAVIEAYLGVEAAHAAP